MLSFRAATSPDASTVIDRVRSPFVTASETLAMARTWVVRLSASWFTFELISLSVLGRGQPSPPSRRAIEINLEQLTLRNAPQQRGVPGPFWLGQDLAHHQSQRLPRHSVSSSA